MLILVDGAVVELTSAESEQLLAEQLNAVVPTATTKLYKSTFIRRLTASEANDLMQVLNSEEAYIQLLYNSVEWFDVTDALVQYLHMTLEAAYGLERADALLEPEA